MPDKDPLFAVIQPLLEQHGRSRVRPERRRAAIIGLDVAGYSLMMGSNEEDTYRRIGRALGRVCRQIQEAGGEVFSFSGDGLMAALPGSLEAVRCAIRIQKEARNRNRRINPERRIVFRIGVNAGEILWQSGRAGGDAVNIAARLEQISPPGGICITNTVFEQVGPVRGTSFISLGEQTLKNIRHPVPVYRVALKGAGALAVVPGEVAEPAAPKDPRPSIAVLPLRNIGSGTENPYFAEGMVEDIIVSLAGLQELVVISRSSTMAFASKVVDPREVGRQLGVTYVVSGNLRRSAQSLRVSVELADAETGVMLWADTTDTAPDDLFEVQDRIVQRIVTRIAPYIREEELRRALRRRPENMTAYDLMLQALQVMRHLDRQEFAKARVLLAKAMELDTSFAAPIAWAVWWHIRWVGQGWSEDPQGDAEQAVTLAQRAIELEPHNALALATMGHARSFLFHDYDNGLSYLERAVSAGPNHAMATILYALTLAYIGRGEEAVRHAEYGLRLSPLDRRVFLYHNVLAWANYANGTFEAAIKWSRLSAREAPAFTANLRVLIASLVAGGEIDEARRAAAQMLQLEPNFSMARYEVTRQPFRDPDIRTRYLAHLRMVGLPP